MNPEKGAYLIQDQKNIDLFLYIKLDKPKLSKALLIDFNEHDYEQNNKHYLSAYFKHGLDYIGQSNFIELQTILRNNTHIDLLNNTFETIQKVFPLFTFEQYTNQKAFVKDQLKS